MFDNGEKMVVGMLEDEERRQLSLLYGSNSFLSQIYTSTSAGVNQTSVTNKRCDICIGNLLIHAY